MVLRRHPANPILVPDPQSDWQSVNVFNPAVILHEGLFHMHYRAQGADSISRIGYAVSEDGVMWKRSPLPILEPSAEFEAQGLEDPRVTELDGVFYMAYTAYAGGSNFEQAITPMFARSTNLVDWDRIGSLAHGEDNKDHFLLPRKYGGRFVAFHRRPPNIWIAESDDMVSWREDSMRVVLEPRSGGWDSLRVGGNGPPIPTDDSWLFFYHGFDESRTYRLGVCLLAREDPSRVLVRPEGPIFEPQESWELEGTVPRVVFSCANLLVDDDVYVYYGAADHVIGLATCKLEELLEYVQPA
jgi:predicted GH43/DUF377 family glycosyl hydrolase